MADLIKVKFYEDGKWADDPADPIFEVLAGEVRAVSANLANIISDSGKGKIISVPKNVKKTVNKNPAKKDKARSEFV